MNPNIKPPYLQRNLNLNPNIKPPYLQRNLNLNPNTKPQNLHSQVKRKKALISGRINLNTNCIDKKIAPTFTSGLAKLLKSFSLFTIMKNKHNLESLLYRTSCSSQVKREKAFISDRKAVFSEEEEGLNISLHAQVINNLSDKYKQILRIVWLGDLKGKPCMLSQITFGNVVDVERETVNRWFSDGISFINKKRRYNTTCVYTINDEDLKDKSYLVRLGDECEFVGKLLDEFLGAIIFNETLEWIMEALPFDINAKVFSRFSENALSWAYQQITYYKYRPYINKAAYLYRLCVIYHNKYKIPI